MISLVLMRKVEIRVNEPPLTRFVVSVSTDEETPEWLEASAFNTSKEVKEFLMVLGVFDPEKPGDPMWPGDPIQRNFEGFNREFLDDPQFLFEPN